MAQLETIGVIGAGQMGAGIAHVCALAGFNVRLNDVAADRIDAGIASIGRNLDRQLAKGVITQEARAAALAQINRAELSDIGTCDFVIEAAVENEDVKRAIFTDLTPHLTSATILASNTSSLSITRLAAVTDRPDRFIGLHFMNPAPLMRLVEVIRGIQTNDETFSVAKELIRRLNKEAALAEDFPAFIVNRILIPMINEACYTLYEGVGTVDSIDTAMKLGANHPMGPLELADFIGLDTVVAILRVLQSEMASNKYGPCPLLMKYVEAGWLGRKTGRGFYDYRSGIPVATR